MASLLPLLQHLVREDLPGIAARSLLNCHVRGMHSLLFNPTPGQRVRLFLTTPDHELHRNTANPARVTLGSLAAHAHHCNLTLHCVQGALVNLDFELEAPGAGSPLRPWHYQSAITGPAGHFAPGGLEDPGVRFTDRVVLGAGEHLALSAEQIHSVFVSPGKRAAWFVYEGAEDPAYRPLSYSDQDLTQVPWGALYQRPTPGQVVDLLQHADLLR